MKCLACKSENLPGTDVCEECGQALVVFETITPESASSAFVAQTPLGAVAAPPTITVGPATPLAEVVDRLAQGNASCVLVVSNGRLVGIFSERDLLRVADRFDEIKGDPIIGFMTADPETLGPDDTVAWALNRMDLGGFRHIPVVENDGTARVVSVKDLLRHLANEYCPTT